MYTLLLMDVVSIPMSLDEFFALDEVLVELVEGQPVVSPAPAARHQQVLMRLIQLLLSVCPDEFELLPSPIDWVLWSDPLPTVRQPDLLVARRDNHRDIRVTEPPVLVVEVVSETSIERDLVAKRRDYAKAGAQNYWIVQPAIPEVVCLALGEMGTYVETCRSVGLEPCTVESPFPVTIVAFDLLPSG
jgi:Uma2 family endonuclease